MVLHGPLIQHSHQSESRSESEGCDSASDSKVSLISSDSLLGLDAESGSCELSSSFRYIPFLTVGGEAVCVPRSARVGRLLGCASFPTDVDR